MDHVAPIVAKFQDKPGSLLGILEEIQRTHDGNYLDEASLRLVSQHTGIPLSQIYSVATFYSYFNLTPQGKHTLVVCRGTACHTRGSLGLLQESLRVLNFEIQEQQEEVSFTTKDRLFTIRTVACFGQCALAPVIALDGTIHSRVTIGKLVSLLQQIQKKEQV